MLKMIFKHNWMYLAIPYAAIGVYGGVVWTTGVFWLLMVWLLLDYND